MTISAEREFHDRIAALEAEHPSIGEEQIQAIEAGLPRCPECNGLIDTIAFVKRTVHKFDVMIDSSNGDVLASSEHHDTLEEEPDWLLGTLRFTEQGRTGDLEVSCADDHSWIEKRLAYRFAHGEHDWTVLP